MSEYLYNNKSDYKNVSFIKNLFFYNGNIIDPDTGLCTKSRGQNRFILTNNKYFESLIQTNSNSDDIYNEIIFLNTLRSQIVQCFLDLISTNNIYLEKDYDNDFWDLYSKNSIYNKKNYFKSNNSINNKLLTIMRFIQNS